MTKGPCATPARMEHESSVYNRHGASYLIGQAFVISVSGCRQQDCVEGLPERQGDVLLVGHTKINTNLKSFIFNCKFLETKFVLISVFR